MVSIRTKLFVSLLALVSFFGILVWVVIDFGLERYYLCPAERVGSFSQQPSGGRSI